MNINEFKLGALESPIDKRDYTLDMVSTMRKGRVKLPTKFRLDYNYPILNQGSVGSCVAFALSELKSYIDGVPFDNMYSQGFIYGYREEDDHQGTGLVTREAFKNLIKYGDCYKNDFPVNEEYPAIVSTLEKYGVKYLCSKASEHKSSAYISLDVDEIKEYLYIQQKPVVVSVKVYNNFYESQLNGGKIPAKPNGNYRGNHLVLVIGYDGDTLIIPNSWGDYNGDKGYFYLDVNSEIIRECWALEDTKNIIRPTKPMTAKYDIGWNKSKNNGKWFYSTDGNECYYNSWQQIKDIWYCFDTDGYALQNAWKYSNSKWYYLQDDCSMATSKWLYINSKWYRFDKDGSMLTGWYQDTNGKRYYLDIDKGYMYTNCTIIIDGTWYSFNSSGALI